jgi:hypothetical protein
MIERFKKKLSDKNATRMIEALKVRLHQTVKSVQRLRARYKKLEELSK